MFHFPAFPPHALYIQARVTPHHWCWVSPFGHPRITARLATPRGLSQPPTSFIGSRCQGIHRVLLHTYKTHNKERYSRPLYSSQTPQHHQHSPGHTRPSFIDDANETNHNTHSKRADLAGGVSDTQQRIHAHDRTITSVPQHQQRLDHVS